MSAERFLVTGALGCIGAWTVKRLLDENVEVWTYRFAGQPAPLEADYERCRVGKSEYCERRHYGCRKV